MILKRFYDKNLAQASYLIGSATTHEAAIVDPSRDVDQYIRAAEEEGLEITHVTETHIHADFVSGARELAERTGAKLYLSDEGDENWKYAFAKEYDAALLNDGDTFRVGEVRIDAVHTPGHTPEHLSFLVTDTNSADRPIGILTGDFVFVGDVGRPDLLERAAKFEGTMEAGARTLFHSLQAFRELPDFVQIWPGHGAGSACGKGISAIPHSTVGYEKLFNWAFLIEEEDAFVEAVLAGQPEPPKYFAEMKRINKEGPALLHGFHRPQRLPESRLAAILEEGSMVVDTRNAADFATGHVPGTINIPLNRGFTTWAGWLIPYDQEFYLIIDESCSNCLDEAVTDLQMIGLDRVAGYFSAQSVTGWASEGGEVQMVPQMEMGDFNELLNSGEVDVLDVRGASEWDAGHVPGARHIPVGYLTQRLNELPRETPLVVHCQGGGRSAIASSVLQAEGFTNVINLPGGYAEWKGE